jgi:predicted nucleotidyltransferase
VVSGHRTMRTLRSILERKEQRWKTLERHLPRIVEQLEALGALKVILFGSFVRGDVGLGSDLDLIAIMPSSLSSREWIRKIYAEIERGIACDILAYSEGDLQAMLPTSHFLRHVLKEGKVIYEAGSARRSATLADPGPG